MEDTLMLDNLVKSQKMANRERQLKGLRRDFLGKLDFLRNHQNLIVDI